MKISLRKARKLENSIKVFLMENCLETNKRILVKNENVLEKASSANAELAKELERNQQLISLRYSIRKRISDENQRVKINDFMNEKEMLTAQVELLNQVTNSEVFNEELVEAQLERQRNILEKGESRFSDVQMNIPVLLERDLVEYKSELNHLKKKVEAIEEELLKKNAGAEVTLSPEEVVLLEGLALL